MEKGMLVIQVAASGDGASVGWESVDTSTTVCGCDGYPTRVGLCASARSTSCRSVESCSVKSCEHISAVKTCRWLHYKKKKNCRVNLLSCSIRRSICLRVIWRLTVAGFSLWRIVLLTTAPTKIGFSLRRIVLLKEAPTKMGVLLWRIVLLNAGPTKRKFSIWRIIFFNTAPTKIGFSF